ncbi:hypothetical protein [Saprospira grandis]|uniref:Uncharacterized protein n=1 Tax=Saprospira grandis (strain Lewin) TaxID=984262 RepID=H6L7F0_SAPGL|nr:hypothetical protein [Saprospira grandis]AFC26822.1 hypothetical protein SGRA_4107 [Saprospira grandis str. Lewin]
MKSIYKIYLLVTIILIGGLFTKVSSQEMKKNIEIDSLVISISYAKENLLLVENKYLLIEDLLRYEGDTRENPSWQTSFSPVPDSLRGSDSRERLATSNQAVALYLIESLLKDDFYFNRNQTCLLYKSSKSSKAQRLYNLGDYSDYILLDKGLDEQRVVLNEEHYKKVFCYYREWLVSTKNKKVKFENLKIEDKNPLEKTNYGWNMQKFR